VRPTSDNATKIVDVLHRFGFEQQKFEASDFLEAGQVIQLGRAPNRIDLLTSLTGVSTDEAFAGKVAAELDNIPVFVLGKEALIRNKRALGRSQDLADIEALEE
jgi:hypothetical protein